jgi:hypothetical protein
LTAVFQSPSFQIPDNAAFLFVHEKLETAAVMRCAHWKSFNLKTMFACQSPNRPRVTIGNSTPPGKTGESLE